MHIFSHLMYSCSLCSCVPPMAPCCLLSVFREIHPCSTSALQLCSFKKQMMWDAAREVMIVYVETEQTKKRHWVHMSKLNRYSMEWNRCTMSILGHLGYSIGWKVKGEMIEHTKQSHWVQMGKWNRYETSVCCPFYELLDAPNALP